MNFVTIETNRLILKGINPALMNQIFENHQKDDIIQMLGIRSEEDYQKELFKFQNGYSSYNRSFLLFLLIEKTNNQIIGKCGIHNWNIDHRRAEIGYVMEDLNYRNKGLMNEALHAIIKYAFEQLNLHRLEALVGVENVASLKLISNNYFSKEGLLREHYYTGIKHEDSIIFSLLQQEYLQHLNKS